MNCNFLVTFITSVNQSSIKPCLRQTILLNSSIWFKGGIICTKLTFLYRFSPSMPQSCKTPPKWQIFPPRRQPTPSRHDWRMRRYVPSAAASRTFSDRKLTNRALVAHATTPAYYLLLCPSITLWLRTCPQCSWPRVLKVAPCKVGRTVLSPNLFGLMGYHYYL